MQPSVQLSAEYCTEYLTLAFWTTLDTELLSSLFTPLLSPPKFNGTLRCHHQTPLRLVFKLRRPLRCESSWKESDVYLFPRQEIICRAWSWTSSSSIFWYDKFSRSGKTATTVFRAYQTSVNCRLPARLLLRAG